MDLQIVILSVPSQTEKDKEMILLYVWNLKKKMVQMNLLKKKIERVMEGENKSWFRKQFN